MWQGGGGSSRITVCAIIVDGGQAMRVSEGEGVADTAEGLGCLIHLVKKGRGCLFVIAQSTGAGPHGPTATPEARW